jgi:hypothetical protein
MATIVMSTGKEKGLVPASYSGLTGAPSRSVLRHDETIASLRTERVTRAGNLDTVGVAQASAARPHSWAVTYVIVAPLVWVRVLMRHRLQLGTLRRVPQIVDLTNLGTHLDLGPVLRFLDQV